MSEWLPSQTAVPAPLAVSVPAAARMASVSLRYLWGVIQRGELPTAKLGRRRVVRVVDLDLWLAAKTRAP